MRDACRFHTAAHVRSSLPPFPPTRPTNADAASIRRIARD